MEKEDKRYAKQNQSASKHFKLHHFPASYFFRDSTDLSNKQCFSVEREKREEKKAYMLRLKERYKQELSEHSKRRQKIQRKRTSSQACIKNKNRAASSLKPLSKPNLFKTHKSQTKCKLSLNLSRPKQT